MTRLSKHGSDMRQTGISKHSKSKGCSPYALIHGYYNKLRYFSSNRCFTPGDVDEPDPEACGLVTKNRGVIGDGGSISSSSLTAGAFQHNAQRYNTCNQSGVNSRSYPCLENFLILSNGRQVLEGAGDQSAVNSKWALQDRCKPSLHHIFTENSTVEITDEKNQIYLYKKNHTEEITNPATAETKEETGDLMEFLFLAITTRPCQKGSVFLELYDLEIEGNASDGLLYVYVADPLQIPVSELYDDDRWPARKELAGQLLDPTQNYFGDDYNLTEMNIVSSAVVRLSDINNGQCVGKKIILNTNYYTNHESSVLRVIVGLKPAEIDHSREYTQSYDVETGSVYQPVTQSYDNNIIMRYSSVKARVERFPVAFHTKPFFGKSEGFIELSSNNCFTLAMVPAVLNSEGECSSGGTHSGYYGYPNGGTYTLNALINWAVPNLSFTGLPSGTTITATLRGDKIIAHNLLYCIDLSHTKRDSSYIVRLPRFAGAWSGLLTGYESFVGATTWGATSMKLVLYASTYLMAQWNTNEMTGPIYDFANTLEVLEEWNISDVYSQARALYDRTDGPSGISPQCGIPSVLLNSDTNLISDWIYHTIDMSEREGDLHLYLGLRLNGVAPHDMSNSAGALQNTTSKTPSHISSSDPLSPAYTAGYLIPDPLYSHGSSYNYGVMAFKAPKILNFSEKVEPEQYSALV